ncbi:FAD-dependent oxidoreductase [Microbulbifer taiwanensis]|uniref:FAD-dependent oxidoreductase n=1 Tax=Microbulbifer taiwanensis TaxID=986746 RepID=A0ABW1YS31_9GAMM|nr:FAD-dependent oxidoreductase [Microbulbifer taiwanensis]
MASEDGQTEFDVIVVGSGAGGMTAALRAHDLGLSVLVIEKSDRYGGSSAMSGGGIWIPNHGKPSAVADSCDEAFQYMRGLVEPCVSDERVQAYLRTGPEMLAYLESETRVSYTPQDTYCDYYPDRPGGKSGGRTLDPDPYDGRKLGDEFENLREQHIQELALGRYALTMAEGRQIFSKESGWLGLMLKRMAKYWLDIPQRLRGKRDRRLVLGNALIGRLRHSLLEREIPLWLNCSLQELIYSDGRCSGIGVNRDGCTSTLRAKRGVILAAGGFEHNQAMRDQYLPQPSSTRWSAGNPNNTGDAIRAGQQLGAAVDLMQHAWWGPSVRVDSESVARILFIEKSLPGLIFVNADGKRFANEAAPYQDYGPNAYGANSPVAYAIFDNRYRQKFIFGPMIQAEFMPDKKLPKALQSGFYQKAQTAAELARELDINPQGLEQTLVEFNQCARAGEDIRFKRGGNLHDRYYGDKNQKPNPCLAPLDKAPFYGVPVYAGDLGTKGGLLTDVDARVLRKGGEVIEGLYAIGNCAASVMGSSYPGAGSTLGPAMTFGYRAANRLADARWKLQTAEGVAVEFAG